MQLTNRCEVSTEQSERSGDRSDKKSGPRGDDEHYIPILRNINQNTPLCAKISS